jgi:hypothetical protein
MSRRKQFVVSRLWDGSSVCALTENRREDEEACDLIVDYLHDPFFKMLYDTQAPYADTVLWRVNPMIRGSGYFQDSLALK